MKIFRGHMGLGDHIICNALVRHLAKEDTIIVPVKKHYETSVKFMFSDNENIVVMPFKGDRQADKFCRKKAKKGIETIWNGDVGPAHEVWEKQTSNFDCRFYEQAGLDFNLRWDGFKVPENSFDWKILFNKRFPGIDPRNFIFLHYTSSIAVRKINKKYLQHEFIFVPDIRDTDNIFDYVGLLKNAKEVHGINSSFLCLADSLNLKGELHYHFFPKDIDSNPSLRNDWIVHKD